MSLPSKTYCQNVEKWILGGLSLDRINMLPAQKFRAHLVTEVYQYWIASPTIEPRKLFKNFAARNYAFLLKQAGEGNSEATELVKALHITEHSVRSDNEIASDIYLLNYLTGKLNTAKKHIHRAMVESNIDWMQNFGRETGTWQAVKQANQDLIRINNDFKEEENAQDQMPNTQINITGDVSIIKSDRQNLSEERKAELRKKYGLTLKEEQELRDAQDAEYEEIEEDKDIFEETEKELSEQ